MLSVGEGVKGFGRLLVTDGQLAVVVEELLAVRRAEPAFLLGIRQDVPPAPGRAQPPVVVTGSVAGYW